MSPRPPVRPPVLVSAGVSGLGHSPASPCGARVSVFVVCVWGE